MSLFILGINHNTAPVSIRERMSFTPEQIPAALQAVRRLEGVEEAALVSTCNRTEIYCNIDLRTRDLIGEWLANERAADDPRVRERFYTYEEDAAVRHLLKVASGLDSMVLGEPQILGQLKNAYYLAGQTGTAGAVLHRLFQRAFAVAKQVRTDTSIGQNAVSVAFAAVNLARQIFADFSRVTALLVGAGDTVALTARHLHQQGTGRMVIANRTAARARELAAPFSAYTISLEEIAAHLDEADIVISSTASPDPIIGRQIVEQALQKRKHRPVFMVDLAVPRDIEAAVGELDDVYLYTVDDLRQITEAGMESRRMAAREAEDIIEAQVLHFSSLMRTLDAVPTIRGVRATAADLRSETLRRARRMLAAGHSPEEALEYLANTLTNRLLHLPTTRMREAGREGRHALLKAARDLFGVTDKGNES